MSGVMFRRAGKMIEILEGRAPHAARENDPLEEKKIDGRVVYKSGFVSFYRDDVRLPDGGTSYREYFLHAGAAAVVALYPDDTIVLERQFRYPCGRSFWEIPAGKIDKGETDLQCAVRELEEECGLKAKKFTELGMLNNAIGYSDEHITVYLAEGIEEGEQKLDPGEFLEIVRVPFSEALEMCIDGRITDVKTAMGIFWLDHYRRRRQNDV